MLTINEPAIPSEREMMMARESQRQLGGVEFAVGESVTLQIAGKSIAVPAGVVAVLGEIIRRMAEGKAVAVVPLEEEVSPQEAAELLGVSRPYAAKLFDKGAIPSRKVGTHRRAVIGDVLAYRQREKEARLRALDELSEESQQLGMGY